MIEQKKRIHIQDIVFIVISLVLATFFLVYAEQVFDYTSYESSHDNVEVVALENEVALMQQLPEVTDKDKTLSTLYIVFGTYDRDNWGTVTVGLYEDDHVVQTWEQHTARMADGAEIEFCLNQDLIMKEGHRYSFSVSESYHGDDNAVAVWRNETGEICYRITVADTGLRNLVMLIAIFLWAVTVIMVLLHIDERVFMSLLLLALGGIYFWLCPVGMAPDESNHFYRAYEISCGNMVSRHMGWDGEGGNILPSALQDYENSSANIDWENVEEYTFGNTSLYSPLSYLPQTVGIRIARGLTNSVQGIFYGGRIAVFITNLILSIAALCLIPFGRKILFTVMCFPMTLQEMISMAPDGFVTCLCLFLLAYVMHLTYVKERVTGWDVVLLAITCLVLSQCKIVYVVMLFLLWMIPNDIISDKRRTFVIKAGIPAIAVLCNLAWLSISAGFLVEFHAGVNSAQQVRYVLAHPLIFYQTVVRTAIQLGPEHLSTMFGRYLGALNINVTDFVWICLLVVFVYEAVSCRDVPLHTHRWDVPIMLITFMSCVALVCASLYVQWTVLAYRIVDGIQGRYYIPVIVLPAFCMAYAVHDRELRVGNQVAYKTQGTFYYMILLLLNGIAILDAISYYASDLVGRM